MDKSKAGCQTIGCQVESCMHHTEDSGCALNKINVEPMCGCHSGEACDESLCGSYKARS